MNKKFKSNNVKYSLKKQNGRYERHDFFYFKAKKNKFVARSIFKLEEINNNFKIISKNKIILDLGCSPGSWLQYIQKIIKTGTGKLVGIDLLPVKIALDDKTTILQSDIFNVELLDIKKIINLNSDKNQFIFDVLLSDMASNTTGIKNIDQNNSITLCEKALSLSQQLLKKNGSMCVKFLESNKLKDFVVKCKKNFKNVKLKRPKSTRVGSKEIYVIATSKK